VSLLSAWLRKTRKDTDNKWIRRQYAASAIFPVLISESRPLVKKRGLEEEYTHVTIVFWSSWHCHHGGCLSVTSFITRFVVGQTCRYGKWKDRARHLLPDQYRHLYPSTKGNENNFYEFYGINKMLLASLIFQLIIYFDTVATRVNIIDYLR
jgi:hypothetical protein